VHVPAPPSSAAVRVPPPSSGSASPRSDGAPDDVALLQRKVAALVAERNDAEARLERARNDSAAADEQVGQMLASIAAIEARLRAAQQDTACADERANAAEERVAALDAEVAKLSAELAREREEQEAMRAVIAELEGIGEERDEALTRVELAELHLRASRNAQSKVGLEHLRARAEPLRTELGDLRRRAVAAEHALAAFLGEADPCEPSPSSGPAPSSGTPSSRNGRG
jgi:chromosome segregation ATPase